MTRTPSMAHVATSMEGMPPAGSSSHNSGWAPRKPTGGGRGSMSMNRRTGGAGSACGDGTIAANDSGEPGGLGDR
eukprot:7564216-Lingulodinium_polyedra.AAC.1